MEKIHEQSESGTDNHKEPDNEFRSEVNWFQSRIEFFTKPITLAPASSIRDLITEDEKKKFYCDDYTNLDKEFYYNDDEDGIYDFGYNTLIKYPAKRVDCDGCFLKIPRDPFHELDMGFDRDCSILMLNFYFHHFITDRIQENGLRILLTHTGAGVRGCRYAHEVMYLGEIVACDDESTLPFDGNKHEANNCFKFHFGDSRTLMYNSTTPEKCFDVIDLDPDGCPSPYFDAAIQSIADGGLLMVTARDISTLVGVKPEECYAKYGSVPLKMKCCHEMAIRILLNSIETHANRYDKYIKPILSLSREFYIRVFVRVTSGKINTNYSMSKRSMIYQCTGCKTYTLHPLGRFNAAPFSDNSIVHIGALIDTHCEHCGHEQQIGGPIWSHPIHNLALINRMKERIKDHPLFSSNCIWVMDNFDMIYRILWKCMDEIPERPLYYTRRALCQLLKFKVYIPMEKLRSALLHAGYRVSTSHANRDSINTDAPAAVLWDILRCWHKRYPVDVKHMLDGTPAKEILSQPCENYYEFDVIHQHASKLCHPNAWSYFSADPTSNWGPGTRAVMFGEIEVAEIVEWYKQKYAQSIKVGFDDENLQLERRSDKFQQNEAYSEDEIWQLSTETKNYLRQLDKRLNKTKQKTNGVGQIRKNLEAKKLHQTPDDDTIPTKNRQCDIEWYEGKTKVEHKLNVQEKVVNRELVNEHQLSDKTTKSEKIYLDDDNAQQSSAGTEYAEYSNRIWKKTKKLSGDDNEESANVLNSSKINKFICCKR